MPRGNCVLLTTTQARLHRDLAQASDLIPLLLAATDPREPHNALQTCSQQQSATAGKWCATAQEVATGWAVSLLAG